MSMVLEVPAVMEEQISAYEGVVGRSVQQVLLDYMQREFARVLTGRNRVSHFRDVLARQSRLSGDPYVFKRQDAYDEELA